MQRQNTCGSWLKAGGMVSVIFMILAISSVAQAIPVTFQFAGTIGSVNSNLTPPIVPTTSISGTYTFESTAPNLLGSSPLVAQYALSSFSLDVLGRHYTMTPSAGLRVIHVQPGVPIVGGTTNDLYRVLLNRAFPNPAVIGPSINGVAPESFQISISGQNLFTSSALPLVPPSLSSLPPSQRTFCMTFSGISSFKGELTSLTMVGVPEPGTLLLLGWSLLKMAGLSACRRMRKPMIG